MDWLVHDPLTRFIAQVAVIIALSRLLGLVARRLDQPMVVAEIVAGIMLGPSLLGLLFPELLDTLFAASSLAALQLTSQLGLVLFMFLVGLELDPGLLRGRGRASLAISHTSIVVPFGLGIGLAYFLQDRFAPEGVSFLAYALFMGIAMSITAFPVLARILAERRLTRTRIGALAIACAAVDDVTAWCLLAFVIAIARSTAVSSAVITTLLAVGYIGVMVWGVRPILVRGAARIANREGLTQNAVAATLLLLLVSAWITELIGVHALFGAFLFGAVFPKEGGFARVLAEKIEDIVLVVLLPLFFAYSGLRTQIGLLDAPGHWAVCALIIGAAVAGKFGGSSIAARLTGIGWREASAIGILMNTRGLMELIVLNIGLDLGVITPTMFTMLVIMALVTTFMTTPLLHLVYPPEKLTADALAASGGASLEMPAAGPGVGPSVPPPFTVLVSVAYGRSGPGLINLAAQLRGRDAPARIYALQLVRQTGRGSLYMDQGAEQAAAVTLSPLLDRAEELGVAVRPLSFISADPGEEIARVAAVKGADLVLLGWHKPVLHQSFLGGTVYDVMREAPCDVGVFVDRGLGEARRVLVPFLGTPHDRAALGLCARLLSRADARATLLHVGQTRDVIEAALSTELGAVRERVDLELVPDGDPAEVVLARSAGGCDLVLMGVGRRWGVEQRLFGLKPERILQESVASVLVVRHVET